MRINIYEEELTDEVEVVSTVADLTGIEYFGTRVYLKSHEDLHHSELDDDRSAVTFWVGERNKAEDLKMRLEVGLTLALQVGADT